jgi:S-DNA-T family DNA segregation ATPase FtsK/SpoIIIE
LAAHVRRHYAAPAAGAATWAAGIYGEHYLSNPDWKTTAAYAAVSALCGLGTVGAAERGVKHHGALYGGTIATGVLAWSAWQVTEPSLPGLAVGVVGTVVGSIPYWQWLAKHRLERHKLAGKNQPLTVDALALPVAADDPVGALAAIGVAGATLDWMERHPSGGWTAYVALPVGKSPRDIATPAQQARLAAALRLQPGWTLNLPDDGSAHHVVIDVRPPVAKPNVILPSEHPLLRRLVEWDPWQPLLGAVDIETGEDVYLHLLGRAGILLAGLQRMGKSVLLSVIVAHLALSRARLILCDAKLVELSLWAPLCQREDDFVGRDPAAFLAKILEIQEEVDRRFAKLVAEGRTKAVPGDGWEPIALIVDELAAFIDITDRKLRAQIVSVLRDILSRGPACLVAVVLATQKPEDKVVPSQIRDVCGQKVALATTTPQMTNTILGTGWASKGATAHLLGENDKGAAFFLEDGKRLRRVQTFPFEPPERRLVIEAALKLWPGRPGARIPIPSIEAESPTDPTPPSGGRHLRSVPCFPDGTAIPDNRLPLWQALDQAGSVGLTINDLVALALPGYNARTSVDGPLQQWRRAGWVVEVGRSARAQVFALAHHAEAA